MACAPVHWLAARARLLVNAQPEDFTTAGMRPRWQAGSRVAPGGKPHRDSSWPEDYADLTAVKSRGACRIHPWTRPGPASESTTVVRKRQTEA